MHLVIKESISDLEMRLQNEKTPNRRVRLEILLLKKVNQESSNLKLSKMLNVHRSTVGRWLKQYQDEGLQQYLNVDRTASKARKLLSNEQQQILHQAIMCGAIKNYRQAQKMLSDRFQIIMKYKNVHAFVCYQMKLRLQEEKSNVVVPFRETINISTVIFN